MTHVRPKRETKHQLNQDKTAVMQIPGKKIEYKQKRNQTTGSSVANGATCKPCQKWNYFA